MNDPLERIFHEPNRLAVMSHLAAAPQGLTFSARNSQNRISRITVGSWNDAPVAGGADTALPEAADSIVWDNGDRISGAIKGLDKRDLVMTTTLSPKELSAPLERMVLIRFARTKAVLPRRRAARLVHLLPRRRTTGLMHLLARRHSAATLIRLAGRPSARR